ncbi:MAG: hypothetical protein Q8Q95_02070 [bacterium]|nr:hypothetical protein [bacterium]
MNNGRKDEWYFLFLLIAAFFVGPIICPIGSYKYYLAVLMGIAIGRVIEILSEVIKEFRKSSSILDFIKTVF